MSSNLSVTAISPAVLLGPRLKAERADQHINTIARMSQALPEDFYRLEMQERVIPPHAKPFRYELVYEPLKPIPEMFALVIGDAIHNLRAALDHLASAIIRTKNPAAKPYFPAPVKRENLESMGWLHAMESALPGSKKLICDDIRPINDGRDYLWTFSSLDIEDKHNLLVPTVALTGLEKLNSAFARGGFLGGSLKITTDAAKKLIVVSMPEPFFLHYEPKASVEVSFGPGTPLEGHPVVPTLLDIRNIVAETLDAFERLIRG